MINNTGEKNSTTSWLTNLSSFATNILNNETSNCSHHSHHRACGFCARLDEAATWNSWPEQLRVYYKILKPMLFGKILYAPNHVDIVDRIVRRANSTTFARFELMRRFLEDLSKVLASVEEQLVPILTLMDRSKSWSSEFKSFLKVSKL